MKKGIGLVVALGLLVAGFIFVSSRREGGEKTSLATAGAILGTKGELPSGSSFRERSRDVQLAVGIYKESFTEYADALTSVLLALRKIPSFKNFETMMEGKFAQEASLPFKKIDDIVTFLKGLESWELFVGETPQGTPSDVKKVLPHITHLRFDPSIKSTVDSLKSLVLVRMGKENFALPQDQWKFDESNSHYSLVVGSTNLDLFKGQGMIDDVESLLSRSSSWIYFHKPSKKPLEKGSDTNASGVPSSYDGMMTLLFAGKNFPYEMRVSSGTTAVARDCSIFSSGGTTDTQSSPIDVRVQGALKESTSFLHGSFSTRELVRMSEEYYRSLTSLKTDDSKNERLSLVKSVLSSIKNIGTERLSLAAYLGVLEIPKGTITLEGDSLKGMKGLYDVLSLKEVRSELTSLSPFSETSFDVQVTPLVSLRVEKVDDSLISISSVASFPVAKLRGRNSGGIDSSSPWLQSLDEKKDWYGMLSLKVAIDLYKPLVRAFIPAGIPPADIDALGEILKKVFLVTGKVSSPAPNTRCTDMATMMF
jgi:hypothetical protein